MKRRIHKIQYSVPNPEAEGGRERMTAYVDAYSAPRARATLFNELFRIESQSTAKADELSEAIRSMSQGLPGISVLYEPEPTEAESQENPAQGESGQEGVQEASGEPEEADSDPSPTFDSKAPEIAAAAANESAPQADTAPAAPAAASASGFPAF
ncbi:hypothetical protein [Thioalkalivibrio sp. ALgr3]|uniref:hypothetical protein n=1 Tax=Thioalkalivibrio sp. ALgr3 TaxID=1239292 RepID=UPI00036D0C49|nr:hypothetical protein [Thioalkalivibrio sp. ALgr3]